MHAVIMGSRRGFELTQESRFLVCFAVHGVAD